MGTIINIDLLSVGIIIAAIGILGFIIFFNNPKSTTNKAFLIFCLLTIAWGSLNYLSYQIHNVDVAFWLLRLSIFTAVWHAFFLFQLLYVFPKENIVLPKGYKYALIPLVSLTALLNLTSFTFNKVTEISASGQIIKVQNGPGIILFSFVILALIISAIVNFVKKIGTDKDITPKQVRPILIGIIVTFALILVFNFIFPAFLNNANFISLGAFFVFPFIVGTAYSIFKYEFLNIKVVLTEILVFVLLIVTLFDVLESTDLLTVIFRLSEFILVLCFGILLIKSVLNEVKQREQMEVLSKQLEEANEKLKALDQARAEFITIASHQLRTPPATIKWYLSALLDGDYGKVPAKILEQLKKTQNTNNHLISLIEDMLNVSRIERGKMEFLFEQTNVEELARFSYEQLLPIAGEKKLKLTYQPPAAPLPPIMADKEKLRQVMNNIIDNALKYTKQGTVAVSLVKEGDEIKFRVKDSGKGISKQDAQAIFQKYSRGKESVKQSAGLGLGLYVAKIIIDQHKGKIWAESQGEGQGSVFAFSLPINSGLKQTTLVDLSQGQKHN